MREIPPDFRDLIEIATFVYCADQAISRGGDGIQKFGQDWRRKFFFRVAVRNPNLWNSPVLRKTLIETLSFLSEDEYDFDFVNLNSEPPTQQQLKFDMTLPEEVVLFSGGLDSLGGAVQEAVVDKKNVALVTHQPTPKLSRRLDKLRELLEIQAESRLLHIPVTINKAKSLGREYTQRSRSFLYLALGSTVAQIVGLRRVRFYENGIVSFNLPPSPQVVGARATRTTHPRVIEGFSKIISTLAGKRFAVENPFLWKTKTDVVSSIADAGCADMIKFATSCTHIWELTKLRTHCGNCSQCIDRRFAILSSRLEKHDPSDAYGVDLLVGERPAYDSRDGNRKSSDSRTMLSAYVETASAIAEMSPTDFFGRFGEAARVLRHLGESADSAALKVYELHKRHARTVSDVVEQSIAQYAPAIRKRELPESCLLRLVCDSAAMSSGDTSAVRPLNDSQIQLEDCVFRKKGAAWIVRYAGGEDFILSASKGAAYLHILLSNPRSEMSVIDLVLGVARTPAEFQLGSAGEATDQQALAAYAAKYEELKEELSEAEREAEQGLATLRPISEITHEMTHLYQQIRKDKGLRNRIRRVSDDRERVRKAFLASVRRTREEIARYDKRLAEHLKPPRLRCGWFPRYDPREDIVWHT